MKQKSYDIIVFTDGASRGNPGPGGWGAVLVGKFGSFEVKEIGGREEHTTNNRMELRAAIAALSSLSSLRIKDKGFPSRRIRPPAGGITVYTDSAYLLNGITRWIHGWQKNGWKTKAKQNVENKDLWETLAELTQNYADRTQNKMGWKLVVGHTGVAGNQRCDEIATAFADNLPPKLYSGVLENYSIKNILDVSRGLTSNRKRGQTSSRKKRSRAVAYSYVSMVNGVIQTHKTWAGCETRVKGKRGARYRKVFSSNEEQKLIAQWRV